MSNILGSEFLAQRDAIDARIWAASSAFNATTDPNERAALRAGIEGGHRALGALAAARGGRLSDPTDAGLVRVFIEAHAQRSAVRALAARLVVAAMGAVAVAVACDGRPFPATLWSALRASHGARADDAHLDAEITREARALLALAEG